MSDLELLQRRIRVAPGLEPGRRPAIAGRIEAHMHL